MQPEPTEKARTVKTTCPYCGVGCGVSQRSPPTARSTVRGDPDHPANFGRLCSKGSALARDDWPRGPAARAARSTASGSRWDDALDLVAAALLGRDRRARPGFGRLLCLGPAADRGLLRRQQADEGLHRLGQHRHQLAPLHGLVRRRPPPRLRRPTRCRAATRISSSPISSCSSAPTSPGATRFSISASRRPRRGGPE